MHTLDFVAQFSLLLILGIIGIVVWLVAFFTKNPRQADARRTLALAIMACFTVLLWVVLYPLVSAAHTLQ
jgi:hypothetical protein